MIAPTVLQAEIVGCDEDHIGQQKPSQLCHDTPLEVVFDVIDYIPCNKQLDICMNDEATNDK